MTKEELFLKTVFCCMACDGDMASEEIEMVKKLCTQNTIFSNMDVEKHLNSWIAEINEKGSAFLQTYLKEISFVNLDEQEQMQLVKLAIKTIEADNRIEYSEVKFFKKIRSHLSISDEAILKEYPDKEDFLLPDINVAELPVWDDNTTFAKITLESIEEG